MLQATERQKFDRIFDHLWSINVASVIASGDRHQHSIADVDVGGVLRIKGEVFVVTQTATYQETNDKYSKDKDYKVTELVLVSLVTGETRYVEWTIDDELEVNFTECKLKSAEVRNRLRDDEGAPFDIDEDVDEAVEKRWGVQFDGRDYPYDDDWAFRYESSDGRSEKGYMYEFGDESGWLTIEGWKDGSKWDYEVFLSHEIPATSVEVIALSNQ